MRIRMERVSTSSGTGSLALKINEQKLATGLFYERNDCEASAECNGGVEEGRSSQNDLIY